MANTSIKHWAQDDRPREKMLLKGIDALSNAELIAILINNGTKDKSAVDVSKDLLASSNNDLQKLGRLSVKELMKLKVKGIGEAKAVCIVAALELGRRRDAQEKRKDKIIHSRDMADYLRAQLQHKMHEVFAVIFLNRANKVTHYEIISEGGITSTIADPRIILKRALEHDAVSIILSHNHPSGSIKPSMQDELLTGKIKEAAKYFDIKVIDHIIVSDEGYFSFADEGIL
ncbi:MAG: DNA repair protein RadC [Parafilimonas sp.]